MMLKQNLYTPIKSNYLKQPVHTIINKNLHDAETKLVYTSQSTLLETTCMFPKLNLYIH